MRADFKTKKWAFVAVSTLLLLLAEIVDGFKFGVTYLILYLLIWFFIFYEDLKPLLGLVAKIKVAGVEAELRRQTQLFEKEVLRVAEEGEREPRPSSWASEPGIVEELKLVKHFRNIEEEVQEVISSSLQDPLAALILLSQKIEFRVRMLLLLHGFKGELGAVSLSAAIRTVENKGILMPDKVRMLRDFSSIRNYVVHGEGGALINEAAIMSFIDSGVKVLRMLDDYLPEGDIDQQ